MNNYPTPMNTLAAFAIVYMAGVVTKSVFDFIVNRKVTHPETK
jgi:hypothetical protein